MSVETARYGTKVPWIDVLLSAIAAVSWALIGMAGTAALGLRLLEADAAGSLGPMTAAVVALGAGGSVTPSGDVSVFGLEGAEATTAIEITPLGVSLVGALLLSWFFLRSLRAAGVVVAPAELAARAGAVVVLFVATLGGLAWAGHDVITLDGGSLGLDDVPGSGSGAGSGGIEIPGLGDIGDLGDIGGLLPDRLGDLVDAEAAVGFTVDTAPTLLGGAAWVTGVLVVALLASRRTPLPRGWDVVHRVVRPTVSALVTVLLVAVAAGCAAAAYAAIGDDHPKRIAGAALLGAPNGVWLGTSIGLLVPWHGEAAGALTRFLPDPLDDLLVDSDQRVTLGRLAELDGRVWLLGVAAALAMLAAGVLQAVRTPVEVGAGGAGGAGAGGSGGSVRGWGAVGFAGRCALRLGPATALALPLLGLLTEVSLDASLSILGVDAFGAGMDLRPHLGTALLLGAVWGAAAGAGGALLAWAAGAAGRRAAPLALGAVRRGSSDHAQGPGPYLPGTPYRPPNPATNPYLRPPEGLRRDRDTEVLRPGERGARGGVAGGSARGSAPPGGAAGGVPPRGWGGSSGRAAQGPPHGPGPRGRAAGQAPPRGWGDSSGGAAGEPSQGPGSQGEAAGYDPPQGWSSRGETPADAPPRGWEPSGGAAREAPRGGRSRGGATGDAPPRGGGGSGGAAGETPREADSRGGAGGDAPWRGWEASGGAAEEPPRGWGRSGSAAGETPRWAGSRGEVSEDAPPRGWEASGGAAGETPRGGATGDAPPGRGGGSGGAAGETPREADSRGGAGGDAPWRGWEAGGSAAGEAPRGGGRSGNAAGEPPEGRGSRGEVAEDAPPRGWGFRPGASGVPASGQSHHGGAAGHGAGEQAFSGEFGEAGDRAARDDGLYGAPTVARPVEPPPRSPRRAPGSRAPMSPEEGPPPPPPPAPPPPGRPK
ncbi:hypothetical protein RKD49_001804 [Streptomyces glaucescens]